MSIFSDQVKELEFLNAIVNADTRGNSLARNRVFNSILLSRMAADAHLSDEAIETIGTQQFFAAITANLNHPAGKGCLDYSPARCLLGLVCSDESNAGNDVAKNVAAIKPYLAELVKPDGFLAASYRDDTIFYTDKLNEETLKKVRALIDRYLGAWVEEYDWRTRLVLRNRAIIDAAKSAMTAALVTHTEKVFAKIREKWMQSDRYQNSLIAVLKETIPEITDAFMESNLVDSGMSPQEHSFASLNSGEDEGSSIPGCIWFDFYANETVAVNAIVLI